MSCSVVDELNDMSGFSAMSLVCHSACCAESSLGLDIPALSLPPVVIAGK